MVAIIFISIELDLKSTSVLAYFFYKRPNSKCSGFVDHTVFLAVMAI